MRIVTQPIEHTQAFPYHKNIQKLGVPNYKCTLLRINHANDY